MILASIEGPAILAAILVIVQAIQWISNLRKRSVETSKNGDVQKSAAAPGARNENEEERMRRFLDALGIPADEHQKHRRESPPSMRQPREKTSQLKPVPPSLPESVSSKSRRTQQRVPPLPKKASPGEAQPPSIPTRSGRTNDVAEFETISSKISAIPGEIQSARTTDFVEGDKRESGGTDSLWREALRSPEGLKSAFILGEIISSPKGLQSNKFPPSFPLL